MYWSYALINGRLGEIHFEQKRGKPYILGHGYVNKNAFMTAYDKKLIKVDTGKYRFTYRKKKYIDQATRKEIPQKKIR
ncbi:MAG: hypothetical protein Q7R54_02640 [bacterium]|nr:hypothetical protein [bacterium]